MKYNIILRLLVVVSAIALFSGCGQSGKLYLPAERQDNAN